MLSYTIETITAKLHYIKSQGTSVNGSIYSKFEISHIHLFALIVAGPFTFILKNRKFEIPKFDIPKFCCSNIQETTLETC